MVTCYTKTVAVAALAMLFGSAAMAEDVVSPMDAKIVDGKLEKSLTGKPGDPAEGRKSFVNRRLGNCLACHVNKDTAKEQFHGDIGPPVDGVAERYDAAQLRAILVNSKAVFGDQTVMPGFYRTSGFNHIRKEFEGKTILTAQQVEDVLAYLLTLKN